uniref:Uncharacterized protein n=1 Tax=Oryza barthii TaxID=65489 RepID=A0A0D3HC08_9ORYZ
MSLGGRIRRRDKAAASAGDKPNAGGATPHLRLPPHHLPRGDEGAVGEEEREDAAVQAQAAARPAPARRPAHRCSRGGDAAAVARGLQIFCYCVDFCDA